MRLEWSSDQGLVREVIGKDSWYHTRSLLGLFPQTVLVYDKPGRQGMKVGESPETGGSWCIQTCTHPSMHPCIFPWRGPVEAFYHHDFEYDVNQLLLGPNNTPGMVEA